MSDTLSLGYSPCPNDTFVFYGLVHGCLPGAPVVTEVLEDIETLNGMATREELDIVKVSFHALGHFRQSYCLLRSGGALGRGCGPLVVAGRPMDADELQRARIAIPGRMTTAALLVRLFAPELTHVVEMPFHQIMDAVQSGQVDAGVIIHESRFTYQQHGLHQIVDLGQWWESTTGHPIPLGGIAARRSLGQVRLRQIETALRDSVEFAHAHPEVVRDYVAANAQEMEREVMDAHIALYVNQYTRDYGHQGEAAIDDLLARAADAGIVPHINDSLFVHG
ncbi:MAG: 1,4-dihydroxy-6-naphthoate synthase [Gemmatimonadetes bacterium]|nr:1,4-dihydroxy-6-naphthoate synthase [Gemmatimonadota bacterium]MBT4611415.1 1,4-dihydroxy-6-naphthoate synthase [Gemmatimonadota bacterium]MBT5057983.1 1,4-dihydroxy-6-naphthoate synthase [Gemmatimonadota bacterium]MBT5144469.1 1,4-dihydroxy-6-naphthoate synthase [Gemmatimonadota bacterium]MBT5587014.1 1,4-dihydroxy-6-naphthoate synthase [Gemmatimonadota bacterium]